MTDKTREDFEAWGDSRQPRSLRSSVTNDYHYPLGNLAFEVWTAATQHSATRIAELEAEVQALRRDAERLDYIQKNARSDPKMDGKHVWWPTTFNHAQNLKGPTIRAAVDAAIEAERTKP